MKFWCKGPNLLVFKQIWASTGLLGCLTVFSLKLFQVLLASENNNFDLWHFFVDHSFNETKPQKITATNKTNNTNNFLENEKFAAYDFESDIFFAELILWNVFFSGLIGNQNVFGDCLVVVAAVAVVAV